MKEDIVICPGCARRLPKTNNGCNNCGFEYDSDVEKSPFRIPTLKELISSSGGDTLQDISPQFLKVVARWGWQYGGNVR